jgi:hypothetical protein
VIEEIGRGSKIEEVKRAKTVDGNPGGSIEEMLQYVESHEESHGTGAEVPKSSKKGRRRG